MTLPPNHQGPLSGNRSIKTIFYFSNLKLKLIIIKLLEEVLHILGHSCNGFLICYRIQKYQA